MKSPNYFSIYIPDEDMELLKKFNAITAFYKVKGVIDKSKSRIVTNLLRIYLLKEEREIKDTYGIDLNEIIRDFETGKERGQDFERKYG